MTDTNYVIGPLQMPIRKGKKGKRQRQEIAETITATILNMIGDGHSIASITISRIDLQGWVESATL